MQTNISYQSNSHEGYVFGHNPFWILVAEEWEKNRENKVDATSPSVRFRSFTTDTLDPVFYAGCQVLLAGDEGMDGGQPSTTWVLARDAEGRLLDYVFYKGSHALNVNIFSPFGIEDADKVMNDLKKLVKPLAEIGDQWVNVAFWTLAPNGAASYQDRYIEAAAWEDVKINYPTSDRSKGSVRDSLEKIHEWKQPPEKRGRLMLLHGPPGTGKTNALAALGRSWKSWCSVNYVVDPDHFFGSAHYMMSVLLDCGGDDRPDKWRLIIVEDADELLSADAKHRQGQDVSRLLNLCDGLVGQGLRVLVLITTNEEVGKMHPAITRPGRCLVNLSIGHLSGTDSNVWRVAHGLKPEDEKALRPATLAELYEELTVSQVVAGRSGPKPIGF